VTDLVWANMSEVAPTWYSLGIANLPVLSIVSACMLWIRKDFPANSPTIVPNTGMISLG
jgi:hypothetical protein